MSVEKIRQAAAATTDTYVRVPLPDLAAAIREADLPGGKGSLAEHVAGEMARYEQAKAGDPGLKPPSISVHRLVHLGPLTGETGGGAG